MDGVGGKPPALHSWVAPTIAWPGDGAGLHGKFFLLLPCACLSALYRMKEVAGAFVSQYVAYGDRVTTNIYVCADI